MSSSKCMDDDKNCSINDIEEAASIVIESLSKKLKWNRNNKSSTIKSLRYYYSLTKSSSSLLSLSKEVTTSNDMETNTTTGKEDGNILSDFLPGYKAPMHLKASNIKEGDKIFIKNGYLSTTLRGNTDEKNKNDEKILKEKAEALLKPFEAPPDSFKKPTKPKSTVGKIASDDWFGVEATPITEELQSDLKVLQMRDVIDPKRFYKSYNNKDSDIVRQVGTVVEGAEEYYSSRLTKKERRENITEEFMADSTVATYAKDKFQKIQDAEKMKRLPLKKSKHSKHVYKRY